MEKEVWKSIPNYEGLYEVSSLGRVKSLKFNKERILKNTIRSDGYSVVGLFKYRIKKDKKVHQLVAMAFLWHQPDGYKLVVDHINGDKYNNRVDNLQLITQRENIGKMNGIFSSKYIGVSWDNNSNKWKAVIYFNGKQYHLGLFKCELAAALAYQNKLKEII